jgi:hypothetical protein
MPPAGAVECDSNSKVNPLAADQRAVPLQIFSRFPPPASNLHVNLFRLRTLHTRRDPLSLLRLLSASICRRTFWHGSHSGTASQRDSGFSQNALATPATSSLRAPQASSQYVALKTTSVAPLANSASARWMWCSDISTTAPLNLQISD